jgi:hypothetical protein
MRLVQPVTSLPNLERSILSGSSISNCNPSRKPARSKEQTEFATGSDVKHGKEPERSSNSKESSD